MRASYYEELYTSNRREETRRMVLKALDERRSEGRRRLLTALLWVFGLHS